MIRNQIEGQEGVVAEVDESEQATQVLAVGLQHSHSPVSLTTATFEMGGRKGVGESNRE
jgi:hypothetical protein